VDVSPLNKWDFTGPDALRAAQHIFSNDTLGLQVGQARYGAFLDEDGLMVAQIAHRTDELAMIAVQGPTSQQTLQPLVERDLNERGICRWTASSRPTPSTWPQPRLPSAALTRRSASRRFGSGRRPRRTTERSSPAAVSRSAW